MRTRSSRRTTTVVIAGLVSFTLVAAACGSDSGGDTITTAAPSATEAPGGTEAPDSGGGDDTPPPATDVVEGEVDTGDITTEPEATGPVAGGTIVYGLEADVDGLNPTFSAFSSPGYVMGNAVFDTLTMWSTDNVPVPFLAESVTPVGDDLSKWQVKLRPGITFHDGTPLNSAAVVKNFELQRAAPLVGLAVRPYYPPVDGPDPATEIIDDLTVQFNLLDQNAWFPGALASQLGMVASPAWLDAAAADPALNQQPVGTGPFIFDSRSQDSVTRFVRNDEWWNGDVWLDAVEFRTVTDPDTRNDLLFSGDVNAIQTDNQASVGDLLDDDAIQNIIDENGEEEFIMINSANPPFDDIRARQALTLATPLETYRQLIGLGIARNADQRFIPESPFFNPDVVQEGDDPAAAAPLVDAYCADFPENCASGKINMELQWSGPSVIQTRIADLLAEGWGDFFNVTFDELPQDEHIQQTALGQYNVVTWRQFGAPDPALDNVWLECRSIGGISLNWPKFCDPDRDALILEGQSTTDLAARVPLYQEMSQKIHDDYLYIFTLLSIWDNAFAANVRGVCDRTSPDGVALRCAENGRTWHSSVWLAE